MIGLHSYVVEVNPDFYKTRVLDGAEIYEPYRGGMAYHNKPCHGTVVATLPGSPVTKGDTLFYVHAEYYEMQRVDGKSYVMVPEESALGYSREFPEKLDAEAISKVIPIGLSFLTAFRLENPAYIAQEGMTELHNPKYFERIYELNQNHRKLNLKKGDIVWTFKGGQYFVPYLPHIAFLRPDYITFNQSRDWSVGEYCLVGVKEMGLAVTDVQGLKKPKLQCIGEMLCDHKTLRKGDVVRFESTPQQVSAANPNVYTPRYYNIVSKFNV